MTLRKEIEYDTMIILQTEYNKMTGEELEQDVAFEMARAIHTSRKINKGEKMELIIRDMKKLLQKIKDGTVTRESIEYNLEAFISEMEDEIKGE